MPEDALFIGFRDFEFEDANGRIVNIANDAAVDAASDLINPTAAAARAGRLETAKAAVQEAALRKAFRDVDRSDDLDGNFDEGSDLDFV